VFPKLTLVSGRREGGLHAEDPRGAEYVSRGALADSPVVAVKLLRIAVEVEPRGGVVEAK
jgi:hypothetical protein